MVRPADASLSHLGPGRPGARQDARTSDPCSDAAKLIEADLQLAELKLKITPHPFGPSHLADGREGQRFGFAAGTNTGHADLVGAIRHGNPIRALAIPGPIPGSAAKLHGFLANDAIAAAQDGDRGHLRRASSR